MNRTRLLSSLILAASLFMPQAVLSAGMILIDPVAGIPFVPPHPVVPVHPIGRPVTPLPSTTVLRGGISYGLRVEDTDVKVEISDQVAKTYVTQTFANDTDRNLAGTFLFPLPQDATFSSFSLHIDGKPVEGKLLEANEARLEYEQIVRRLVDPGLLEYADYKNVRARIFPIPAHGTKKVELEYTQLLHAENGMLAYRFPLKTEGAATADHVNIDIKMASKLGLRTIWSPSHKITTTKDDDHKAKVSFAARDASMDKDFFLYYSLSDKDLAANVLTNKATGEDGYYLLTLTPPVQAKTVAAKDIVLVADTSGSMMGERLKESKEALKFVVNALKPDDRFSIIKFDTDIDCFKTKLVSASPENKKAAAEFIDDLEAHGGTNIGGALKEAVSILNEESGAADRPGYLVMMTDGEPTVGEQSTQGLLKTIDSKRDIRLFDFGVGYDVNTSLLNKLAEEHHGTAQYVEPSENIETALSSFYSKIESPVLSNVKIAYQGVQVKDVYPRDVKDLFAGTQVLVLGRYKGAGAAKVQLTGTVNGAEKSYTFPIKFGTEEGTNSYLPRLWAMRRIAYLTEVARENGDTREIVDEIVALSKKFGMITAYTSFLVTDPNEVDGHGNVIGNWRPAPLHAPPANFGARHFAMRSVAMPKTAMDTFVATAPGAGGAVYGDEGINGAEQFAALQNLKGAAAVKFEKKSKDMRESEVAVTANLEGVKTVGSKTFYLKNSVWVDSAYDEKNSPKPEEIQFASKQYFDLLSKPGIAKFLAVGEQVIFVFDNRTYKIVSKASV